MDVRVSTERASAEEREWDPYFRAWRERLQQERLRQAIEAASARQTTLRAAVVLVQEFGCTKAYLFGSLTGKGSAPFGPHSDVDLAVEGLSPERYFRALVALENVFAAGARFDLVRLEDAVPSLAERIRASGEVLADGASVRGTCG